MRRSTVSPYCSRQRRSQIAAAALLAISDVATVAAQAAQNETIASRSQARLHEVAEFDGRAKQAYESRSLAALQEVYAELQADAAASEQRIAEGRVMTGCDMALSSLLPIVGFAINRIDGGGRYRDWMRGESERLLQSYHASIHDCALDSGSPPVTPQLTAQHVKAF